MSWVYNKLAFAWSLIFQNLSLKVIMIVFSFQFFKKEKEISFFYVEWNYIKRIKGMTYELCRYYIIVEFLMICGG